MYAAVCTFIALAIHVTQRSDYGMSKNFIASAEVILELIYRGPKMLFDGIDAQKR